LYARDTLARWSAETHSRRIHPIQRIPQLAAAGRPADTAKLNLKKAQLAAAAESEVAGTGWLPEPIRIPVETTE
jgi:hypothetical protein